MYLSYEKYRHISGLTDRLASKYRILLAGEFDDITLENTKQDLYILLWLCIYDWAQRGFSSLVGSLYKNQSAARRLFIRARYPMGDPAKHARTLTSLDRFEPGHQSPADERKGYGLITFEAFEDIVVKVDEMLILVFAGHGDNDGENYPPYFEEWDECDSPSFTKWLQGKLKYFMNKRDKWMPVSSNDWFITNTASLMADSRRFTSSLPLEESEEGAHETNSDTRYVEGQRRTNDDDNSQESDIRRYETVEAAVLGIERLFACRPEKRYDSLKTRFGNIEEGGLLSGTRESAIVDEKVSLNKLNTLIIDIAYEDVRKLFESNEVTNKDKRYSYPREQFDLLLRERVKLLDSDRSLDDVFDFLFERLNHLYGYVKRIRNTFPENPDTRDEVNGTRSLYDKNAYREMEDLTAGKWPTYKQLMKKPLEDFFSQVSAFHLSEEAHESSLSSLESNVDAMSRVCPKCLVGREATESCYCSERAVVSYLIWFLQCCRPLCDYRLDKEKDCEIRYPYAGVDRHTYAVERLHDFLDEYKERRTCQKRKTRFVQMLTNYGEGFWLFDGGYSLETLAKLVSSLVKDIFNQDLPLDDLFERMAGGCKSIPLLTELDEPHAEVAYAWAKACAKSVDDPYRMFYARWKACVIQAGFASTS